MEPSKGGGLLLDALPAVQQKLQRPVHATFAGDGGLRRAWQARASREFPAGSAATVEFTGWVGPDERDRLLDDADLLVVPSLWPEPFGLIGLEAAGRGVPAAAFDVGGIGEWLRDGINGYLAPARPPRAEALAEAIAKCLTDPAVHARISGGALQMASVHSMQAHATALLEVLGGVAAAEPLHA
jgi:glycosyltransferase involved in cell wall biosynthesis